MANQTSSVDTTVRIAFAVLQGVLMGISFPLLAWLLPTLYYTNPLLIFAMIIPIAYITSLGINTLVQFLQCQKISMGQVAGVSLITPGFVTVFSLLTYYIPFLRGPIESLIPEDRADMKDRWAYLFYLFWAGMYGQTVASGLLTSC